MSVRKWDECKTFEDMKLLNHDYLNNTIGSNPWVDGPLPRDGEAMRNALCTINQCAVVSRAVLGVEREGYESRGALFLTAPDWQTCFHIAMHAVSTQDVWIQTMDDGDIRHYGAPAPSWVARSVTGWETTVTTTDSLIAPAHPDLADCVDQCCGGEMHQIAIVSSYLGVSVHESIASVCTDIVAARACNTPTLLGSILG